MANVRLGRPSAGTAGCGRAGLSVLLTAFAVVLRSANVAAQGGNLLLFGVLNRAPTAAAIDIGNGSRTSEPSPIQSSPGRRESCSDRVTPGSTKR